MLARRCALLLMVLLACCTLHAHAGSIRARTRAPARQAASRSAPGVLHSAMSVLMASYDPVHAWWPSSWWNSAVATTTLIDYVSITGDKTWVDAIDHIFETNRVAFPPGGRAGEPIYGNFTSKSLDDTEWWGLAWVAAYDLTGDAKYLDMASAIGEYVAQYYDVSTCGGGIWWNIYRTYKNAITNGLYVRLMAALSVRISGGGGGGSGSSIWQQRTLQSWSWLSSSALVNSAGLVNDGLTGDCANNGQTVWTYNCGLFVGAAAEVFRATGNATALALAQRWADAATSSPLLVQGGVLTESCDADGSCNDDQKQFKGITMRYVGDLNALKESSSRYDAFLRAQVAALNSRDRNATFAYGARWNGAAPNWFGWRTQASAIEALLTMPGDAAAGADASVAAAAAVGRRRQRVELTE